METKCFASAVDTLRTHYTTVDQIYEVLEEDEECYKIIDNRGKYNWIPKRYMQLVSEAESESASE